MARYMPQELFEMCAVSVARWHLESNKERSIEELSKLISSQYEGDYANDGFEKQIADAAQDIIRTLDSQFSTEEMPAALRQMQYCIKNFHPNGKRKRKRFFDGTWFRADKKSGATDRVERCVKDIFIYHVGAMTGIIPLAPNDWTL